MKENKMKIILFFNQTISVTNLPETIRQNCNPLNQTETMLFFVAVVVFTFYLKLFLQCLLWTESLKCLHDFFRLYKEGEKTSQEKTSHTHPLFHLKKGILVKVSVDNIRSLDKPPHLSSLFFWNNFYTCTISSFFSPFLV